MGKQLLRDKKAISPVIATVILVAVAITVAVAVAYWMGNIAGTYTAQEKIEMPSSYAVYMEDLSGDGGLVLLSADAASGQKDVMVAYGAGSQFSLEQYILIKDSASQEINQIESITPGVDPNPDTLTMVNNLANTYTVTAGASLGDDKGWKVFIQLKNSGSRDATITNVFLNEIPLKDYGVSVELYVGDDLGTSLDLSAISVSLPKGEEAELILWIYSGTEGCSSGTTIDIKMNSAAGSKYPVMVRLP